MMIEYVPVTGRVCVARLKLLIVLEVEVSTWPSGLINFTVTPLIVLLVIWTVDLLPGCAAESQLSILPGSAYAHRRRAPPTVVVPLKSAGTSYRVKVTLPTWVELGSTVSCRCLSGSV